MEGGGEGGTRWMRSSMMESSRSLATPSSLTRAAMASLAASAGAFRFSISLS
jgi:hypothetical protein